MQNSDILGKLVVVQRGGLILGAVLTILRCVHQTKTKLHIIICTYIHITPGTISRYTEWYHCVEGKLRNSWSTARECVA